MEIIKEYVIRKKEELKQYVFGLKRKPKLVIVQVNDDPASNAYINGKLKDLAFIGAIGELVKLDVNTSEEELLKLIDKLNKEESVDAFIVQMPLPKQIDEEKVKRSIDPKKDVDGFNPLSNLLSATPKGIITYLEDQNYEFKGGNVLVIGRSNIVGKPLALGLLAKDMNVTIVHSKTSKEDLKYYVEHADLICIAVGNKHFLTNEFNYKKNLVLIDVGINRDIDNKLYGDASKIDNIYFQSSVPGGVGLLTRLALLINLIELYKEKNNEF